MTIPLPFVWPYWLPFWIVYVWAFVPEARIIRQARVTKTDSGSLRVILARMNVAMLIAFVVAFFVSPVAHRLAWFWAGTATLLCGSLLRRHCFRVLGEFFTGAVNVAPDQKVIDRGAYKWVRHPSYTAGILVMTGIGLALGNWVSVALVVAASIAVYSYRVAVEEKALLSTIGEPYRTYMAGRKRFIPFVV